MSMLLHYPILSICLSTAIAFNIQNLSALTPRQLLDTTVQCPDPDYEQRFQVTWEFYDKKPSVVCVLTGMVILKINSVCPASLSSPSNCTNTRYYEEHCVAYCEQFLYWFFAYEVPFPNSQCQPGNECTWAGAKSVAVTNSYSFNAGLSIGGKTGAFEGAFNLGASYTYTVTSTAIQTLTSVRPSNTSEFCGYWR